MTDNAELLPCPEGWRLVPVEATEAMLAAAHAADRGMLPWAAQWRAMLSAAPVPASAVVAGEDDRGAGIRIAIWNAATARGMSQDAAIALVLAAMAEPTMVRTLSTRPRVSREEMARAVCAARAAQFGDPPCYELNGSGPVEKPICWDGGNCGDGSDLSCKHIAAAILALIGGGE